MILTSDLHGFAKRYNRKKRVSKELYVRIFPGGPLKIHCQEKRKKREGGGDIEDVETLYFYFIMYKTVLILKCNVKGSN